MESGIEAVETRTTWTLADLDASVRGDTTGGASGGVTMRELCQQTGSSPCTVTDRLYKLKATGKLHTAKERREGLDGKLHLTTVYYIDK